MAGSTHTDDRNIIPPLILQHGITDSFIKLLEANKNECTNEVDFLALAIHELMQEAGFHIQRPATPSDRDKLPDNWKNGDMYRFNYIYCDYSDVKCSVTALLAGNSLLVTGTLNLDESEDAYHVKLKTTEYIDKNELNAASKEKVYQNLSRLSHKLKDNVTLMMINEIKTKLGLVEEVLGLLSLPQELKLRLICDLDVSSVCCLARVNKELKVLCEDDEVWKRLLLREFRGSNVQGVTHKEAYKHMYLARKREQEARRRELENARTPLRPDFDMGPDLIYTPGIGGPHIPGIIGGYQDLHPGGLPRHPFGGPGHMNPPDLLLNRNRIQRPPGARYDPLGPIIDDDIDFDPLRERRVHPDVMRRPGFGPDGGFGGRFGGGGFGGGGFGGGFGGFT